MNQALQFQLTFEDAPVAKKQPHIVKHGARKPVKRAEPPKKAEGNARKSEVRGVLAKPKTPEPTPPIKTKLTGIEVPISQLAPGEPFGLTRVAWGRDYGTKFGVVLEHGVGTTKVRWRGREKETSFTPTNTGKEVHFISSGGSSYVAQETRVQRLA